MIVLYTEKRDIIGNGVSDFVVVRAQGGAEYQVRRPQNSEIHKWPIAHTASFLFAAFLSMGRPGAGATASRM